MLNRKWGLICLCSASNLALHQQPALLLQLAVQPDRVPDLQRDAHHDRRARTDRQLHQPRPRVQLKKLVRTEPRQHAGAELHRHNRRQQQHLVVEMRILHLAPHPAIDTQVDQRRKRPDLVRPQKLSRRAEDPRHHQVHRQRKKLMMQHRGHRQQHRTDRRRRWPHHQRQQNRRFKRQVRRQKIRHAHPDPHAQHQRHAHHGNQLQRVAPAAMLLQQQPLERNRPRQRTGHRRRDAQLHQQRNQDQPRVACPHASTLRAALLAAPMNPTPTPANL